MTPPVTSLKAPNVVSGDLDASVLLGDLPFRATQLGAGPARVVASGPINEGERLGAFVDVPANACLLTYARGSSSIEDIDVVVFAEEGNPIAADEGPDPHPTVLVCPPHPDRVYLAVHAAAGEGLVALAAQLTPRDRAAEVALKLGARGSRGEGPRSAEAWPGLDERVRAHRAALGGHWEETKRVAVTADARTETVLAVTADADQCVDVLAVADEGVALLELELTDGEGRVIARAREATRERSVLLCTATAIAGSLHLRPHVGNGLAAVVVAKTPLEDASDLGEKPETVWYATSRTVEQAKKTVEAELARAGYVAGILALAEARSRWGGAPRSRSTQRRRRMRACGRDGGGAPLALRRARCGTTTRRARRFGRRGRASDALLVPRAKDAARARGARAARAVRRRHAQRAVAVAGVHAKAARRVAHALAHGGRSGVRRRRHAR